MPDQLPIIPECRDPFDVPFLLLAVVGEADYLITSDRAIRSERHYYTTLNYIHYNPVKHNLVASPYNWVESSLHWYIQVYGRQWLRDSWIQYPLKDDGKNWDD